MKYYTDLFSPETYHSFCNSDQSISGFRVNQKALAQKLKKGDKLICYVTRLSRWVGVLEVLSECFEDYKPIFSLESDPFIVRVIVKPIVWLPLQESIPIHDNDLWKRLSFTKDCEKTSTIWTGMIRNSLRGLIREDGKLLEEILIKQNELKKIYELNETDQRKLKKTTIKTPTKEIKVVVPDSDIEEDVNDSSESTNIQAVIARIGERMKLKVWIPKRDRSRVFRHWKPQENSVLDYLPLNYDDTTLKTIENIDVIWIKGRSIVRAFEVEHTTSVYSGILRMADLMALQPNLDIKAHIVAPDERKDKVMDEIQRPVFSLLEKGHLHESCSFISYSSIRELSKEKRLEYMHDSVIEQYEELAEEI